MFFKWIATTNCFHLTWMRHFLKGRGDLAFILIQAFTLLHWNQPVIATITSQFELLKIMNISTHHNDRMLTTVYNSKAPHINSASFSYRLSKMSHLHVKDKLAECPKATWFLSKGTWKCVSDSPPLCVSTTAPQNYDVCEYEMSHVLMPEFRPRITISRFLLSIG